MVALAADLAKASEDTKQIGDSIVELLPYLSDYPSYEKEFEPPDTEEAMGQEGDQLAKFEETRENTPQSRRRATSNSGSEWTY